MDPVPLLRLPQSQMTPDTTNLLNALSVEILDHYRATFYSTLRLLPQPLDRNDILQLIAAMRSHAAGLNLRNAAFHDVDERVETAKAGYVAAKGQHDVESEPEVTFADGGGHLKAVGLKEGDATEECSNEVVEAQKFEDMPNKHKKWAKKRKQSLVPSTKAANTGKGKSGGAPMTNPDHERPNNGRGGYGGQRGVISDEIKGLYLNAMRRKSVAEK